MRLPHLYPALLALAVSACAVGRRGAIDASRFRPESDRELLRKLGDYPNPGPSASHEIRDGSGKIVAFPAALAHFADEVVSYEVGVPGPIPEGQDPRMALGPPDYSSDIWSLPRAVTLGNGGSITLHFTQGALIDGEGPDLFIFEVGPSKEAMRVDVSADGQTWIPVGEAPGGFCAIDIGPFVKPGDAFHYVRLRDLPNTGGESDSWPGADIDAVAIVGSSQRLTLPSEVLFEFDSETLSPSAAGELDRVVEAIRKIEGARVTVEGHTDDVGTDEYNRALSERRAESVSTYLVGKGVPRGRITARGLGKSRPAVVNDGDASRKKNRRVEIVIRDR